MVVIFPLRSIDPGAGVWEGLQQSGVLRVAVMEDAFREQEHTTRTETSKEFSPEERSALQLIRWSITPQDEASDRAMLAEFVANVKATRNQALQQIFRDLFVSLYTSKYKHLSLDEVRAMINTTEIFDDIHESLAYQQYGEEVAAKTRVETQMETKLESALAMLQAGILIEQVASILNLPVETIEDARKTIK